MTIAMNLDPGPPLDPFEWRIRQRMSTTATPWLREEAERDAAEGRIHDALAKCREVRRRTDWGIAAGLCAGLEREEARDG